MHLSAESNGKWLKLVVVFTFVVIVMLSLAYLGKDFIRMPVNEVIITGDFRALSQEVIEEQLKPVVDSGFFWVNLSELQRRLLELPWIDSVSARRNWPDKISIHLKEHQPLARWRDQSVLTTTGKVLRVVNISQFSYLPWIWGPDGQEMFLWETYQRFSQILSPIHLGMTRLILNERGSWEIDLDNQIQVFLGNEDLEGRLARFVLLYPELQKENETVESVDLRYPHGLSVAATRGSESVH